MDAVFRALSDRNRRLLLDRLHSRGGQTLGELCLRLKVSRQAIAKHLQILEEANLVATIWRGREKLHYLNPIPIAEIQERWLGKYQAGHVRALAELKRGLEAENEPTELRVHDLHRDHSGKAVGRAHKR